MQDRKIRPVSKLQLGSPVTCLAIFDNIIFAGCGDGGFRLIEYSAEANFDYDPRVWHGLNSTGLTCISIVNMSEEIRGRAFRCVTGGEDGSITIFDINQVQ